MKQPKYTFFAATKNARLLAFLSIIIIIAEVVIQVFMPNRVGLIINEVTNKGDVNVIWYNGFILIGLALGALCTGLIASFCSSKATSIFAKNIRNSLYSKIQSYSFNDIDKFSTGAILNRLNNDVNNVQLAFMMMIRTFVRLPILFITALIFSLNQSLILSSIFLVSIPLVVISFAIVSYKSYPNFKKLYKQYDSFNSKIQENLSAIRTIKSYVNEENEFAKIKHLSETLRNMSIRADKIVAWNSPVITSTIFMSMVALGTIGTYAFLGEKMEIGTIVAFASYIWMVSGSLMGMMNVSSLVLMSIPSVKRIKEILNHKVNIQNDPDAFKVQLDGSIKFENVNFKYVNSNLNALSDFNLDIKPNETIGIIGPTGSGKSTLINLIVRFYDASSGQILLNGVDIKKQELNNLREQIAFVTQESTLFSGTIRQNLLWANPNASDDELNLALKQANIYDFVNALPEKLDSRVEQKGQNFSGGQKQRLSIARSLLKKPRILILDDATSAVDSKTEMQIQQALSSLTDCTKIIIAQKISSLKNCDRIIVLDDGKIQNIGTHQQLLNSNQFYQELYQQQQDLGGLSETSN
ncbi:ABC transporter ATP-binding protein [Mycoplasma nasistruthionis]|uniref:ABC transporter ATP-binding protein n=1 Tax=Mycoplasma nasistruthionis TaxID=353852 RepID=A0A4Y6I5K1_9MOLU|nr:ABC transporter ATP-binding protein [Mycoplasma nasistruthionis]QDF64894.1 ABC transporter ATP-binding protein [Mycoplasma nasistruthionis]